jgi:SAM-dependent methyltransferase
VKQPLLDKLAEIVGTAPVEPYRILDFGCGAGHFLGAFSKVLHPGSEFVGIDSIEESVQNAQTYYPHINFVHQKFTESLPFPEHSFDYVVSVDTIECIPNKSALVQEFHRVLKPGGHILASHWDWDTQLFNSAHRPLLRKLITVFSDWKQDWMDDCDGLMGRKLWATFEGSGKFRGKMDVFSLLETAYEKGCYGYDRLHDMSALVTHEYISLSEYEMIVSEMETLSRNKQYFYSLTSFIYCGERA